MSTESGEPSKVNAQINQTVGSAKQLVGSVVSVPLISSTGKERYTDLGIALHSHSQVDSTLGTTLQTQGQQQYNEGVAEQKAAEAKGYVEGTAGKLISTPFTASS
jgi:hypothetical protein